MMRNNLRAAQHKLLLIWVFVLQYSYESCFGASILCLQNERHALLRFKQSLNVPPTRLLSWNASQPDCCDWDEIVCDNLTGHVEELHLHNPFLSSSDDISSEEFKLHEVSKLQGEINPSLVELKHLRYLDLSDNDFGGIPIPNLLSSLASLTYLNLSYAGFEGLISHQLENLTNLQYLSIRSDLPSSLHVENLHWLKGMSSLVHLDLQAVNLSASSHEWLGIVNALSSLQELHLSSCGLDFMPSLSTVNFTSLSVLDISDNLFSNISIPKWISSLSNLKSLDLSFNYFGGPIPNAISNLSSLTILNLNGNQLISPMPHGLFQLPRLVTLSLTGNHFSSPFPTDFQNLTSLRHLDISQSNFSSSIPEWVYRFPHLETLYLSDSNLRGEISDAIQNLTSLITLDLSYNQLEGTIPKTMTSLCNLQTISLFFNKFSGEISEAIKSLSGCSSRNLLSIQLGQNGFSGVLTDEIAILENLSYLALGFNFISGNIPPNLGILSNLKTLVIHHNKLAGFISEVHFRNLTNLRRLYASNNNLTLKVGPNWVPPFQLVQLDLSCWNIGPKVPSWLQYQHDLNLLDLSRTGISGSILSWVWNFNPKLFYFELSHNQMNGALPSSFLTEPPHKFMTISLSSNQFSGPLPRISTYTSELDLSNNSFSGPISELLCNPMTKVNNLKFLHLGSNHLSGEIPNCWMYWKSLKYINLENNNFRGKIPSSIAHLPFLEYLHLRNNSLSGEISVSLKECTKLVVLDIGLNSLSGKLPKWLSSFEYLIALLLPSNKLEGGIPSEICHLTSLQLLNLASNNLSGSIPTCINNFTAMSILHSSTLLIPNKIEYTFQYFEFIESARVYTKGYEVQYESILIAATNLDISNNNLSGHIPQEITVLLGLRSLNLSRNNLTGEIPTKIGDMQELESIDLSSNKISGRIPSSMSTMHFLSYLNLSCNNLCREIPLSTQLQSFNSSSFGGNKLCGPPLTVNCSVHATPPDSESGNGDKGEEATENHEFSMGMVVGFVVGFWGIFGPLLYSRSWRISYFRFLSGVWYKLCRMFNK